MYCRKCGAKLNEDQEVCLKCGTIVNDPKAVNGNAKSKIAAGILGIFLGTFGVHNFYLGYTGKGTGQLLITILSCGILSFVSWIWAVIESVMILTGSINADANGVPLSE